MKRYMQKYFSAVIAVALLLTMTGCSDRQPSAEEVKLSISADVAEPSVSATQESTDEASQPTVETPETVKADTLALEKGGFPIPTMTREQSKYNMQYVEPLRFSALLLRSWNPDDISQLEPKPEKSQTGAFMMFAFEDIIGSDAMQAIWKDYPDGQIPEAVVDEVLLTRFSFTLDQLHQMNVFYRSEQNLYDYTGARGGGPMETVVTAVTENEDGAVLLEYVVFSDFPNQKQARYRVLGTMTLVPDSKGGYRYLSVESRPEEKYPMETKATLKIDDVTINLTLISGWTALGNELYWDDVKVAELLPCAPNGDAYGYDAVDKQYGAALATHEYTAGGLYGKCYHIQSEVSKDGLTVLENELHYYTDIPTDSGSQLLHFAFYPLHGTGIESQRETFEVMLNSLVIQ